MRKVLKGKIREALSSVLPITVIVLVLSATVVPMPIGTILLFLAGSALLIVGMGLFTLGAEMAMIPMGEGISIQLEKSGNPFLAAGACLMMGVLITVAEPDLQVLAHQVPSIPDSVLIWTTALGVGIFLMLAMLRVLFRKNLAWVFLVSYALIFFLTVFTPPDFIPMAFDSGGVTTGSVTVPFIMAFGVGLASIRGGEAQNDSFGWLGLSSIGPVMAVLILGTCYRPSTAEYAPVPMPDVFTTRDVARQFLLVVPASAKQVLLALAPIVSLFVLFQAIFRRFQKHELIKIGVGLVYTLAGLVLFLSGVNVGFVPAGHFLGAEIGASAHRWLLVPLGMLIGYYIVAAEPAVYLLNRQIEEVSNGAISRKFMFRSLSAGVSVSIALSMVRLLTGISILWFLIPGYAAALTLTFWVPPVFTGIAFDSGGVASGTMTATFVLPFTIGACSSLGGNVMTDAFGVVAMVAMTPVVAIQLMGLLYRRRAGRAASEEPAELPATADTVIDYEEESSDE